MFIYKSVRIEDEVEVELELTNEDLASWDTYDILEILAKRNVPDELLEPIREYQKQKLITPKDLEKWVKGEPIYA